jgi:hypothetical protein
MSIPKFRSTKRFIQWVEKYNRRVRLPADSERCFFKDNGEGCTTKARNASRYADYVGVLDERFENIIKTDCDSIVRYSKTLAGNGKVLPRHMEEELKSSSSSIYDYAIVRKYNSTAYPESRLPEYLEDSITSSSHCIKYAKEILQGRLPKHIEDRLFCSDAHANARNFVQYATAVGPIEELEHILLFQGGSDHIFQYEKILKNNKRELSQSMIDTFSGDNSALLKFARSTGKRLPKHLEDTLDDPLTCLSYAQDVLKHRLPEHLELVFMKDHVLAYRYSMAVVRGMSSPRLPEELHAFMLMKSFENPNDNQIKDYINNCERAEKLV